MERVPQLFANVGWTSFSGVFSTVFPLVILLIVLSIYTVAVLRRRGG
ncbi:MAG: hypothetical protein ACRDPE_23665 [Solirubrobacterales bacterium]